MQLPSYSPVPAIKHSRDLSLNLLFMYDVSQHVIHYLAVSLKMFIVFSLAWVDSWVLLLRDESPCHNDTSLWSIKISDFFERSVRYMICMSRNCTWPILQLLLFSALHFSTIFDRLLPCVALFFLFLVCRADGNLYLRGRMSLLYSYRLLLLAWNSAGSLFKKYLWVTASVLQVHAPLSILSVLFFWLALNRVVIPSMYAGWKTFFFPYILKI